LKNLYNLLYDSFVRYLVEKAKYPAELKTVKLLFNTIYSPFQRPLNHHFAKKGMVLDRNLGNLLKVDSFQKIVLAYHGYHQLTDDELVKQYGPDKKTEFGGGTTKRYWSLTTYFESHLAPIYAMLIDFHDSLPMEQGIRKFQEIS
jgi:hypothetical protein